MDKKVIFFQSVFPDFAWKNSSLGNYFNSVKPKSFIMGEIGLIATFIIILDYYGQKYDFFSIRFSRFFLNNELIRQVF